MNANILPAGFVMASREAIRNVRRSRYDPSRPYIHVYENKKGTTAERYSLNLRMPHGALMAAGLDTAVPIELAVDRGNECVAVLRSTRSTRSFYPTNGRGAVVFVYRERLVEGSPFRQESTDSLEGRVCSWDSAGLVVLKFEGLAAVLVDEQA